MESINPEVNKLHAAYVDEMNIVLGLNQLTERQWWDAHKMGVTPEMVRDVVRDRHQRIRAGVRMRESLYLRNMIGDVDRIADLLNEAAVVAAQRRVKVVPKEKASVLSSTGRPDFYKDRTSTDPNLQDTSKPASHYIAELRKAAG